MHGCHTAVLPLVHCCSTAVTYITAAETLPAQAYEQHCAFGVTAAEAMNTLVVGESQLGLNMM